MRRAALVAVLVLLVVPRAADAATYCVGEGTCTGTAVGTVQDALDLAQGHPGEDRIGIGRPTGCPLCTFLGGSYSSADPLEIVGAGTAVTRVAPTGSAALSLGSNANVTVSDLTVLAPSAGTRGLRLSGARAERVDAVVQSGADGATAVELVNGGGFRNGRVTVAAIGVGISATDGAVSADSALVRLLADFTTAVRAESAGDKDVALNARHLTIAGSGSGSQYGAAANASAAGQTVSLNLRNSIVHAVGHPLSRSAVAGATAQIAVDYSNYDPSGNLSPPGGGGIVDPTATNHAPGFVDEAGGDFRLAPGSASIEAGEPGVLAPIEAANDLAGNPRRLNGDSDCIPRRDLGAYEFLAAGVFVTATVSPSTAFTGDPVAFGSLTCDPDPAASLDHEWSFDDGGAAPGAVVQHAFLAPGVHSATLTVTSDTGRTGSGTATVDVAAPPIQTAAAPSAAPGGPSARLRPLALIVARAVTIGRGGIASIALRCTGKAPCSGTLELRAPRARESARRASVKLGSKRFEIPARRTTRVNVRLSRSAVARIAKRRRLRVTATVRDRDASGRARTSSRSLLLQAPRR